MTPDEIEARDREWLKTTYLGDSVPQLTVRSIVLGVLLGGVMSFSNLYVGLKIGWGVGVAITSSILAYAIMRSLRGAFPRLVPTEFSILENNTMASCASAAGYISSAGLVMSIPALDMMIRDDAASGHPHPALQALKMNNLQMAVWIGALSALGVIMAIPLKRQFINIEQLRFPEGIAAAETLKSMYATGVDAARKARGLLYAGLLGGLFKFAADVKPGDVTKIQGTGWSAGVARSLARSLRWKTWSAPDIISLPIVWNGYPLSAYSLGLPASTLLGALGALIGMRVGLSLGVGGLINFGVMLPALIDHGVFERVGPHATSAMIAARHHVPVPRPEYLAAAMRSKWSVWPGTAIMVSSGLLSFAFRWRTVGRALASVWARMMSMLAARRTDGASAVSGTEHSDKMASIEVPASWFVTGFVMAGVATVLLQTQFFGIRWWLGILAVLLTFVLSMVAARATGETNINPIGAMGKITQLSFGWLAPTAPAVNLMTANVTAGAASHSADLLQDLKTGYLLGANPRKQVIAQFFGVAAGAILCAPVYRIIAPPEALGTTIPAPAAMTWRAVAELLTHGFGALPMFAKQALVGGLILGSVLACLEEFAPKAKKWLPSPVALGIGLVVDSKDSMVIALGAIIAWLFAKWKPVQNEHYTVAVSSGLVAGESLMGVLIAACAAANIMGS